LELNNGTFLDRYSAPVCGKDGKHYGRIWTFRDVTEQKRNEFALNKSEELYRSLFENMVEGYAYFRILYKETQARDILYLSVNNAFERLTGLKSVVGRKLSEVIPGIQETNPEMFEIFGRVALTGKTESFDTRLESLGKWLSITVYSHEQGHCIAVFENITEKKRVEGRLRRLMDSNAQSVFFWNTKGEVMEANDAFLGLVGYTREELQEGRINWVELTPPEFAGLDREALEQIVATGSSKPYEKEFIHKDGSRVSILIGAAGFEDNTSEGVCFLLDLTERKLFEAQLMQSQKLETVGKLAGGIAHEFNSILTAILGQSELLLGELPVGSPQAANVMEISQAAERASGLTRQLLAYGRKQFLHPEILDLNRVIASMSVMIQHLMGAAISTQIIADPDLHAVMADAGQIEHVIINLVMNAREAMSKGGKLTLKTKNVTWDEANLNNISQFELKEGKYVMMAIADTGVGMSDAVKSRVFEPFFTTKEVGEGTGLGLATCYGIIKQSGGHVSVESEQGRGSTFRVYLPEVEAKTKLLPQRVESADLPRGTETILLVEEDPALRELAAALLTSLGYKMLVAGHASEALNLNLSRDGRKLDLLCTDLGLPPLTGWDLVERIRVIHPDLRILFTSSFTANAIRSQDALQRDVAVLQKPFTPFALARKLREVLDQG